MMSQKVRVDPWLTPGLTPGRLLRCCAVLCWLLCPPALGAVPAPYGAEFARFGSDWNDGVPPPATQPVPDAAGAAQREAWLAQLASAEIAGGPYADGLAVFSSQVIFWGLLFYAYWRENIPSWRRAWSDRPGLSG